MDFGTDPTPFDPTDDDYCAFDADADDWVTARATRDPDADGTTFMRAKTAPQAVALRPDPGSPR